MKGFLRPAIWRARESAASLAGRTGAAKLGVLIAGKTVATILPFASHLALLKCPAVVTFLNEASVTS